MKPYTKGAIDEVPPQSPEERATYLLRKQQERRLRDRTCETCGKRPASQYHRATDKTRAIAVCGVCKDHLDQIIAESPC